MGLVRFGDIGLLSIQGRPWVGGDVFQQVHQARDALIEQGKRDIYVFSTGNFSRLAPDGGQSDREIMVLSGRDAQRYEQTVERLSDHAESLDTYADRAVMITRGFPETARNTWVTFTHDRVFFTFSKKKLEHLKAFLTKMVERAWESREVSPAEIGLDVAV